MHRFIIAAFFVLLILSQHVHAAGIPPEKLVVTHAKLGEEEGLTTRRVTVIRRAELERMGLDFLDDVLRRIGVVQVLREGGQGGNSRLLIRGVEPVHSVILIDGVRAQSTFDGYLDLSGIPVNDIERIEISRGTHSVAYGSQAIGGVVNIITQKGGGPFSVDLAYGQGSNGAKTPSVTVSGGKRYLYRLSASALESEGISSAQGGTEADGYEATSYSGSLAMSMGKGGMLEVIARRDRMDLSLDRDLLDDPDYEQERDRKLVLTRFTYSTTPGVIHTFTGSEWEETLLRQDSAVYNSATSRVRAAGYQADVYETEGGIGIVGLEHKEETAELYNGPAGGFTNTVSTSAAYLNLKMEDGPYTFLYGIRQTEHEVLGDYTTYSVSALQQVEGSSLKYSAAYATGLRLPTALELELNGSGPLRAETSKSWEVGFEKGFGTGRSLSLLYFDQELRDLITNTATGLPVNSGAAEINGVECIIASHPAGAFSWSLSYTWLEAEGMDTGEPLPLRPEDRVDLRVGYSGSSLALVIDYSYVGKRPGLVPGTRLRSYDMLNIGGTLGLGKTFSIYGRVDNALDEEYVDISGFGVPGREYYAGIKASF